MLIAKTTSPADHPEFTTHKYYVEYMRSISDGLTLKCKNSISARIPISDVAKKKVQLIKLTIKNLETEAKIVERYPEYAEVAISWMPVKAYYLIFNLTILLEYLISGDARFLTTTHQKSLGQLRQLIETGELSFSQSALNEIKTGEEIEALKVGKWDNLRSSTATRKSQIFRKLADYAKDDLRRKYKTDRLNRAQMAEFRKSKFILPELFYWYRIKVNYRDLEFISSNVTMAEFKKFHQDYNMLTRNFYRAFKPCINHLSMARSGSHLL